MSSNRNTHALPDKAARDKAIDATLSAIVQAPAGSGKTELLTQRFLNLLCTVKAPEEVVALTFTRKAAHEMRERVLKRIETTPHVLAHDKTHQWHLLENPSRLRITTLDSLCQRIAKAMPLQEKHVPYASITSTPEALYWEAARACFQYALDETEFKPAITTLLTHLDNRIDVLLRLFAEQLAQRDQWLYPVLQARTQTKATLEHAIAYIEQHAIAQFKAAVPCVLAQELIQLAKETAAIENNPESPRYILTGCTSFDDLDGEYARALAALLLTSQNQLRKSFDHHVGLKKSHCADAAQYNAIKQSSKALLESLADTPDFLSALIRVSILPPAHYPKASWEPLQALLTLLPLLAGHLQMIFEAHQCSDFIGITQQALDALGDDDAPSDLALHFDYMIKHLLVDEFQDTSLQQFELIRRLTRGFEVEDNRTLFVVGDPMQSIYRFRAAEVGLFLKAQQHGIGAIYLTPLYLKANFRTTPPLVDWVNQQFASIFPHTADIESGAVPFHHAIPAKTEYIEGSPFSAYQCDSPEDEAQAIATLCKAKLDINPDQTIAILVRSRNQLSVITRALEANKIAYQGLDTDLLMHRAHVQDIWSLTQALLMPTHRLAWLAFLKSPWCGICLEDLYQIANHAPKAPILTAICDETCLIKLSKSGQNRMRFVGAVLLHACKTRHQYPISAWLIHTLNALHAKVILSDEDFKDLTPFFEKLSQFEQDGLISELSRFEEAIEKLYGKTQVPAKVQLMTIHKSKGLEFDTVILPGLGKRPPHADKPLIRWLNLPSSHNEPCLLISPLHPLKNESSALYDYLGAIDAEKNHFEQQRLLYVAATRAKYSLYLFDHHDNTYANTFKHDLSHITFEVTESTHSEQNATPQLPQRIYLPDDYYHAPIPLQTQANNPPSTLPAPDTQRAIGILTHELLEWICTHHPQSISEVPFTLIAPGLNALGLSPTDKERAQLQIKQWIQRLFNHPKGQWIIKPHQNERNEYEIIAKHFGEVKTFIIDRLFEADNICWIIDFKTGEHTKAHQADHTKQLNRYANLIAGQTKLPIHCGIYYLQTEQFIEWSQHGTNRVKLEYAHL